MKDVSQHPDVLKRKSQMDLFDSSDTKRLRDKKKVKEAIKRTFQRPVIHSYEIEVPKK